MATMLPAPAPWQRADFACWSPMRPTSTTSLHWSEAASGSVQISLDMTPSKRLVDKRALPEEPATPRKRRKRVRTCLMELQMPSVAPPATRTAHEQLQEVGSSNLLSLLADAASSEEGFAESDCSGGKSNEDEDDEEMMMTVWRREIAKCPVRRATGSLAGQVRPRSVLAGIVKHRRTDKQMCGGEAGALVKKITPYICSPGSVSDNGFQTPTHLQTRAALSRYMLSRRGKVVGQVLNELETEVGLVIAKRIRSNAFKNARVEAKRRTDAIRKRCFEPVRRHSPLKG